MKKILFLTFFAVISLVANAQNEKDSTYEHFLNVAIEWGGNASKKPFIPKVSVEDKKSDYIFDESGEKIKFASRSALINYFTKKGWHFVQLISDNSVEFIVFKKLVKNEYEAKQGFVFKN